jgi:nucleotide-binding universal stress UspA family protein
MNIVIAYDGSNHAKAAVDDLRRSGMPRGVNALVVSVGETFLPTPSATSAFIDVGSMSHRVVSTLVQAKAETAQAIAEASVLAREGTQRVHSHFPRWGVYADHAVGTPAHAITQKADDWRADLIVVGSHGRSALARLVLGSVSQQVATESRCPVRVARHVTDRGNTPVRIIIAVDGSPDAEAAVHAVALRAWHESTEVRLIAVEDTVRTTGPMHLLPIATARIRESQEEQVEKAHGMMKQATDLLHHAGLQVSTDIREGSPPEILSESARAWEADCIFVGARGFSGTPEQVRTGKVAMALVTHAPCSVEIVRS